jgi:hypothetical protein
MTPTGRQAPPQPLYEFVDAGVRLPLGSLKADHCPIQGN